MSSLGDATPKFCVAADAALEPLELLHLFCDELFISPTMAALLHAVLRKFMIRHAWLASMVHLRQRGAVMQRAESSTASA